MTYFALFATFDSFDSVPSDWKCFGLHSNLALDVVDVVDAVEIVVIVADGHTCIHACLWLRLLHPLHPPHLMSCNATHRCTCSSCNPQICVALFVLALALIFGAFGAFEHMQRLNCALSCRMACLAVFVVAGNFGLFQGFEKVRLGKILKTRAKSSKPKQNQTHTSCREM